MLARFLRTLKKKLIQRELMKKSELPMLERFEHLTSIASTLLPEYKFKWPLVDWWESKGFNAYLKRFGENKGYNTDRRWMVSQLLRLIEGVTGDTAECGVYSGATSWLICKENKNSRHDRLHFAFDSFSGLSNPNKFDGNHWSKGDLCYPIERVQENLSEFDKVCLMQGWIPERFSEVSDRHFSFVHIDVDLYSPTRASLEFFYSHLSPGGILICDDFGSTLCPGATKAVNEFFKNKQEKMVAMSGGGGFIIKGVITSNGM